jgi:hypothetical protein
MRAIRREAEPKTESRELAHSSQRPAAGKAEKEEKAKKKKEQARHRNMATSKPTGFFFFCFFCFLFFSLQNPEFDLIAIQKH